MADDLTDLIAANRAFYAAFAGRDMAAMERLWARRAPVACLHPGWGPLLDRDAVLASWRQILGNPGSPAIRPHRERALLFGDTGLVICQELLNDGVLIASNLFVREDGEWRLVHHHGGPLSASAVASDEPAPRLHS